MAGALAARLLAAALALLGLAGGASGLSVFGYVPEYRFDSVEWESVFRLTTHVVLFSVEPNADGGLEGLDRLQGLLRPQSPFRVALKGAGNGPRLIVTVGGAGRSQHFAAVTASKQPRRRLAKALVKLLTDVPIFTGLDLDWETPKSETEWRNMGKLAKDIRVAFALAAEGSKSNAPLVLSFTYHPGTGAVQTFSKVKAKESGTTFVQLFDFCHAMAYSQFDRERRHSSHRHDLAVLEEWKKAGLPMEKLTLGMPFFGVNRNTGETITYGEIVDKEPSVVDRPDSDEASGGLYFVNAKSAAEKVELARRSGLAGVMIWELGQDKRPSTGKSLLQSVSNAVKGIRPGPAGPLQALLAKLPVTEDQVFLTLALIIGSYLFLRVLVGKPPPAYVPPPRPTNSKQARPVYVAETPEGDEAAPEAAEEAEDDGAEGGEADDGAAEE